MSGRTVFVNYVGAIMLSREIDRSIERHLRSKDQGVPLAEAWREKIWCVDGRATEPVYGVLGGSGGALLRMVGAFIASVPAESRSQAWESIKGGFPKLLDACRSMITVCTHTDQHAVDGGQETGCGYLKMLRDRSQEFGLPDGSIVSAMIACRKESDGYMVLPGDHAELGVLVVQTRRLNRSIRAVQPSTAGQQYFVYHPQVEQELYRNLETTVLKELKELTGVTVNPIEFRTNLERLTGEHVVLALAALAPGKPVYDIFLGEQGLEIRETANT